MLILTFIELILNSFVQASFSLSSQSLFYMNFYFIVPHPILASPSRLSSLLGFSSWCSSWCGRLSPSGTASSPGSSRSSNGHSSSCLASSVTYHSHRFNCCRARLQAKFCGDQIEQFQRAGAFRQSRISCPVLHPILLLPPILRSPHQLQPQDHRPHFLQAQQVAELTNDIF